MNNNSTYAVATEPDTGQEVDAFHSVAVCNSLLRGQISAVETYDKVISKFSKEPSVAELKGIYYQHQRMCSLLKNHIRTLGGEPEEDSGAWGVFAKSVQAAANLFGEKSAICTLTEGERMGRADYQESLADERLSAKTKELIERKILPQIETHIRTLKLLSEVGESNS